MRFSIRDLLWTMVLVAIGWAWLDRSSLLVAADSRGPDATSSKPDDGEVFLRQHRARLAKGELKAALADAEEQIRLRPALPHGYVARAIVHVINRDFRQAAADMQQAITKRGDDNKGEVNPVLTREALEHGQKQVRAMLKDRPVLVKHIHENDAMWTWAVRRFAGEQLGSLVDWDRTNPVEMDAFCFPPREKGEHGRIQVHDSRYPDRPERGKASFDELWQRVVFELHNIVETHKVLPENRKQVIAGRMSKDQYIRSCLVAEIRADKKVQAFYAQRYLLWGADKNINADCGVWHVDSYWTQKWERDVADPNKYVGHRQFLGEQYDIIWLQKLVDQEKWDEGVRFAKAALPTMYFKRYQGDMYRALATCYEAQGQLVDALRCLKESIKLDPNEVAAYLARANFYLKFQVYSYALADYDQVIKLAPLRHQGYMGRAAVLILWPDDKSRDGKAAVADARRSCELTDFKDPQSLMILGAAHAETGDFNEAVAWTEKAVNISSNKEKGKWQFYLNLFKSRKTLRDAVPAEDKRSTNGNAKSRDDAPAPKPN